MSGRLAVAIISTALEESAIALVALWVLPQMHLRIPVWALAILMVAWGSYSVITYRLGSRALKKKQLVGLPNMIGTEGRVVKPLTPEGMVMIRGELWTAKSDDGEISAGKEVTVIGQERLKIVVRETDGAGPGKEAGRS